MGAILLCTLEIFLLHPTDFHANRGSVTISLQNTSDSFHGSPRKTLITAETRIHLHIDAEDTEVSPGVWC